MNTIYEIARLLDLGAVTEPPRRLSGGFLHSMYSLCTERGKFAVKLLNPYIMSRPTAKGNYLRAEELERRLEQTDVSILPALSFDGQKMQHIHDQFFYVFDYFDGCALQSSAVQEHHCIAIASQLARIHAIEQREQHYEYEDEPIDWNSLSIDLSRKNPALGALLSENLELLQAIEDRARAAFPKLPQVASICHNDMDCKNVLWNGDDFRIIDLECLGWNNPAIELYETALSWSGIEQCNVNPQLFTAFIRAYETAGGTLPHCMTTIHDANCGRLHWLAYNIRRALGIDCSADEITIGENEVRKTIPQLIHYSELRNRLSL